jgi:hypothetical protein
LQEERNREGKIWRMIGAIKEYNKARNKRIKERDKKQPEKRKTRR